MNKQMKIHRNQLKPLQQQVNKTVTCIQLVPSKMNTKLDLSLLNLPPPPSPLPNNIIHDLISKPLQKFPHFILIKPTQWPPHIQLLYHLKITSPPKASWTRQIYSIPLKISHGEGFLWINASSHSHPMDASILLAKW